MRVRTAQLHYFVVIAEERQVTRAARRLNIAQPALSQAISQLEKQLGFTLFERHARGVALTAAAREFLPKAQAVLARERELERHAELFRDSLSNRIVVGFIGPPPTATFPELFEALAAQHPDAEVSLRDLPFPRGTTRSWIEPVDVALCHRPDDDADVTTQLVRLERRAALVPASHPAAQRTELAVADVLDETFVSYGPDVQPRWAAFHSLDEDRGGPPLARTRAHAGTALQVFGILTTHSAITTVPYCDAKIAEQAAAGVSATPLLDAKPASISLIWRAGVAHPLVDALADVARNLRG